MPFNNLGGCLGHPAADLFSRPGLSRGKRRADRRGVRKGDGHKFVPHAAENL